MPNSGILRAALALLVLVGAVAAKEPLEWCGTYFTKAQEEAFLHLQHAKRRGAARFAADSTAANRSAINQDFGDIAVIGDGNGVIGRSNAFDLGSSTLTFTPADSGYRLLVTGTTYDASAALAPRLDLADDDTQRFTLPFSFPFFGTGHTSAWVNSNGTITFTEGDRNFDVQFGRLVAGPPAIAGLFADLDPSVSATGVRVQSTSERFVVTFDRVPLAGGSTNYVFQMRLFPNGRIEFAYNFAVPGPSNAIVGIVPGNQQPTTLTDLSTAGPEPFTGGLAELFLTATEIDITYAAQRFYQTHDDTYDYLVFYNISNVSAGPGTVAYELTVRSSGEGYGDVPVEDGAAYGSPRRLQAVLNLGRLDQYPTNPDGIVQSRAVVGDTPLTILGHEAGHLWLALVSVPNPTNPFAPPPMLGAGLAHWAFTFNSDASFMEGNRVIDNQGLPQRYTTANPVQHYSSLDQYLMGLRAPEEVPSTFAVLNSGIPNSRAPEDGINFNGDRFDIGVNDVIASAGRRTPDATVAQRHFRFAFILIVPENSDLSPGGPVAQAVATVDEFRRRFEPFFAVNTDMRATADTTLRRASILSLHPAAGVVLGQDGTASIAISAPTEQPLTYTISTPGGVVSAATVTIPPGQTQAEFTVTGNRAGVEEIAATPSDSRFDTIRARVQVELESNLRVRIVQGNRQAPLNGPLPLPVVAQVVDKNNLPYSDVRVTAAALSGSSVLPSSAVTNAFGNASFQWSTIAGSYNALNLAVEGQPVSATAVAPATPTVQGGAVVNAASFAAQMSPNSFGTVFGGSLAGTGVATGTVPFPSNLAGTQVRVNGINAALSYVSDFQVNFIVPPNIGPGQANIVVATQRGASAPFQITIAERAPGIFYNTFNGFGAILIAGTANTTAVQPAKPGDFLEIYCTGLGNNPVAVVNIGGVNVPVTYAGPSYLDGLQQVNVQIPANVPGGQQLLGLTVNGLPANNVIVHIAQ